jgi:hypothetical protein
VSKQLTLAVMSIGAILSNQVSAQDTSVSMTGNETLSICSNDSPTQQGFCVGYVIGLIEGMKWGVASPLLRGGKSADEVNQLTDSLLGFCLPEGATNGQYVDVFITYLVSNPGDRHNSARILAQMAFTEAFPCDF